MSSSLRFDIYKDHASEWRWRLVARNGKTIADSSEGYENYTDCQAAIMLIKSDALEAPARQINMKA